MKIIDNMGLLKKQKRHKGRYAKKGIRWGRLLLIIVLIGANVYIGYKAHFKSIEPWQVNQVTVQQDDGLTPEQRANLAKQADLAKQETVLMNKKTKLDSDYKIASAGISITNHYDY